MVPIFSGMRRPVRVLSPCVGLNAPERAAREMKVQWQSVGDWEINPTLRSFLELFTNSPATLHVGRWSGDVSGVQLEQLDLSVDGLVSGPPSPPFSSIGARLGSLGSRSSVCMAIMRWISYLPRHGNLTWFVLENVPGILQKRKTSEESSFGDWFAQTMGHELSHGWNIDIVKHDSIYCRLPQNRARVFFVGTSGSLRATRRQRRILDSPLWTWPWCSIQAFLDKEPFQSDFESLSMKQQKMCCYSCSDFVQ